MNRHHHAIDLVCPVNWLEPLNRDLVYWGLVLPGLASGTLLANLCSPGGAGNGQGTLVNFPTWQPAKGRPGGWGSLEFVHTSDQYVNLGNPTSLQITAHLTIAAWVRRTTVGGGAHQLVTKDSNTGGRAYTLDHFNTDRFRFYINGGGGSNIITGGTAVAQNTWYHLVATYHPAGRLNLYVNAKSDATEVTGADTSIPTATANVLLARREYAGFTEPLSGNLDSVRIYRRTLSAAEVAELYREELSRYPRTLRRVSQPAPMRLAQEWDTPWTQETRVRRRLILPFSTLDEEIAAPAEEITLDKWHAAWMLAPRRAPGRAPWQPDLDQSPVAAPAQEQWFAAWALLFPLPPEPVWITDHPSIEHLTSAVDQWYVAWTQNFHRPLLPPLLLDYPTIERLTPAVDQWFEPWTQNFHRPRLPPLNEEIFGDWTRADEIRLDMWQADWTLPVRPEPRALPFSWPLDDLFRAEVEPAREQWDVAWQLPVRTPPAPLPLPYEALGDIPRDEEILADKWYTPWLIPVLPPVAPLPLAERVGEVAPPTPTSDTWYSAWTQNYARNRLQAIPMLPVMRADLEDGVTIFVLDYPDGYLAHRPDEEWTSARRPTEEEDRTENDEPTLFLE